MTANTRVFDHHGKLAWEGDLNLGDIAKGNEFWLDRTRDIVRSVERAGDDVTIALADPKLLLNELIGLRERHRKLLEAAKAIAAAGGALATASQWAALYAAIQEAQQ